MPEPIRVLLVEDNEVYRESLALVLGRRPELAVVGGVATGGAAASACVELGAHVVLVDYRLPDVDGAEVADDLRERCPDAAVVFLSASVGPDEQGAARSSGAPLVGKDEGVDAIVAAVLGAAGRREI